MKVKQLLFLAFALFPAACLFAQSEINIERITVINYGDGRLLFRERESEKPLEGERRLIDGIHSAYVLAHFKEGFYHGKYQEFHNNNLATEGTYENGLGQGLFKDYYRDGKTVHTERELNRGKVTGLVKTYRQDGTLETEKGYLDGEEHGIERRYDEEGNVKSDCHYKEGKRHGKQVENISGNRKSYLKISEYDMGLPVGEYSETLTDGVVRVKGSYAKGKKEGEWHYTRDNGIPEKMITYKNDLQEGKSVVYYTDGTPEAVSEYAGGKRNGLTVTYYFDTGKTKSEYNYKNGKKEGDYKLYDNEGRLKEEGRCEDDRDVFRREYHENGQLKSIRERTRTGWETLERYNSQGEKY